MSDGDVELDEHAERARYLILAWDGNEQADTFDLIDAVAEALRETRKQAILEEREACAKAVDHPGDWADKADIIRERPPP